MAVIGVLATHLSLRPQSQVAVINAANIVFSDASFQLPADIRVIQHWDSLLFPGQTGEVTLTIQTLSASAAAKNPGLMWQARLELPYFNVSPADLITQSAQAPSTRFAWKVSSLQKQQVEGTLWLNLVQVGAGNAQKSELVMASPVKIEMPVRALLPWQVVIILGWSFLAVALLSWILVLRGVL